MINNLFVRVRRIIKSNLHAFFQKIENSESTELLTQTISEIDSVIDEVKAELGRMVALSHRLKQERQAIQHKHRDLEHQISAALKKSSDEDASHAIKKQIEIETEISLIDDQLTQNSTESQSIEAYLKALQSKKKILTTAFTQMNSERWKTDPNRQKTQLQFPNEQELKEKIAKAELTFDRIMANNAEYSTEKKSYSRKSEQLREIEEMALKTEIKERLTAAKRGIETND